MGSILSVKKSGRNVILCHIISHYVTFKLSLKQIQRGADSLGFLLRLEYNPDICTGQKQLRKVIVRKNKIERQFYILDSKASVDFR